MQTWRQRASKSVTVIGKRHGLPLTVYFAQPRPRSLWERLKRALR